MTEKGKLLLRNSLDEHWQERFPGVRQTRERRAEFLQQSIATSQKLLNGEPVDKSTILVAFHQLRIPWDESYCVRLDEKAVVEIQQEATAEVPTVERGTRKSRLLALSVLALGFICMATLAAMSFSHPSPDAIVEPWRFELNGLIAKGTEDYNKGLYGVAQTEFEQALRIARRKDVAGGTAECLRMLGDVASARGDLNSARSNYLDALEIRQKSVKLNAGIKDLSLAHTIPPLMEALGVVETRLKLWNEAREHLQCALQGYSDQKLPAGIAMARRGLGTLAYKRGLFADSLEHFGSALDALDRKDVESDLAYDIRARQALSLAELGQADSAAKTLATCLRHWERSGHARWQAETRMQLGLVAVRRQKRSDAECYLNTALVEFQKVGDTENARQARELLATIAN